MSMIMPIAKPRFLLNRDGIVHILDSEFYATGQWLEIVPYGQRGRALDAREGSGLSRPLDRFLRSNW